MNIYVPSTSGLNEANPLPIMVWLPGEGFDFADARQFNGAYLASMGNVIVITVQYRVGVFGFLKDNVAIWDQLAALEWINKNAANFGGDALNVTLFGRFTGSMSISMLLSSPVAISSQKPLFTRAILMSGIAVGSWVFDKKHDEKVNKFYQATGCTDLACLKAAPADQLLAKSGYGWKPSLDTELIPQEPLAALQDNHFPSYVNSIMLGGNKFEGNICLLKHLVADKPFYDKLVSNNVTNDELTKAIQEDVHMFYGEDIHMNLMDALIPTHFAQSRSDYVEFCANLLINSHMNRYHTELVKLSKDAAYSLDNVYNYMLDYKPSFSIAPDFINSSIHGDDVILAFGLAFKSDFPSSKQDQQVSQEMVSIFSHFAQAGTPMVDAKQLYVEINASNESESKDQQQEESKHEVELQATQNAEPKMVSIQIFLTNLSLSRCTATMVASLLIVSVFLLFLVHMVRLMMANRSSIHSSTGAHPKQALLKSSFGEVY